MGTQEIVKFCLEKGLLLDKDVLNLLNDIEEGDLEGVKIIIEKLKNQTQKRIITKNIFIDNNDQFERVFSDLPNENKKILEKIKIKLGLSIGIEIEKEISPGEGVQTSGINTINIELNENKLPLYPISIPEYNPESNNSSNVKIISMIPAVSKKLEVEDFIKYFRARLSEMKKILQSHSELNNLVSLNKISGNNPGISIIGIVYDKKVTKNKNILLELEDSTGNIKVLVNQNKPELYKKAEDVALDSVIGVKGSGNREIIFANDIIFPEANLFERKKSPIEEYALFTGDLHVGSKLFMEENFLKFIDYLNGKFSGPDSEEEVEKIKYLFLVGDLIAGVGIFPGQEKELTLTDVEEQYQRVAELLGKIRKDIKIIIIPGNHDALRIMEPQPLLDEKYAWPLYELPNVVMVGNPSVINIASRKNFSGFNVLLYHGYSFHYYANNISRLMQEQAVHIPDKIMHYLLKQRHLAPTHASTLYFPSEDDALMIKEIPDIFFSGHTHKSAVSYYNNILTISSSSWESLTPFQEKMGNQPDFCKVPMLNLKTRGIKILDFE